MIFKYPDVGGARARFSRGRGGRGGGELFSSSSLLGLSREVIRASSSRKDLDIRVKNRSEEREDGVEIRFVSSPGDFVVGRDSRKKR